MIGRKGMVYDRYPESWQSGSRAPNLQSFGEDVAKIGVHRRDSPASHCSWLSPRWSRLQAVPCIQWILDIHISYIRSGASCRIDTL